MKVCSRAVVVAISVNADGLRELLGLKGGTAIASCSGATNRLAQGIWPHWRQAGEQRCSQEFHQCRSEDASGQLLSTLSCSYCAQSAAARIQSTTGHGHSFACSVFAHEKASEIEARWDVLASSPAERLPNAARVDKDELAFRHFPELHSRRIWSTNMLEWVNEDMKRRSLVMGIFPNETTTARPVYAVLPEG